MNLRRLGVIATTLGLAATAGVAAAPAATAADPGTRSLAAVLTSDGNRFDSNWYDYDIVTEAVLAVLGAKPTARSACSPTATCRSPPSSRTTARSRCSPTT